MGSEGPVAPNDRVFQRVAAPPTTPSLPLAQSSTQEEEEEEEEAEEES